MDATLRHEDTNDRDSKSSILALLLFMLFLSILIIPIFRYQIPPPGQEGVLVSFGEPDKGSGEDAPRVQKIDPNEQSTSAAVPEETQPEEPLEEEEKKSSSPASASSVLTTREAVEVVVPKTPKTNVQPTQSTSEIDLEAQRKLDEQRDQEAAARKAEEEKKKFEASKQQFSEFLSGSGKGQTNTAGNQGDPQGDPNADILTGITKGTGRIGGGLSNRGVLFEPEVKDESQKTGKIVMNVCVNGLGKVTEVVFTQRGSTSLDGELREKAKRAAERYTFTASEIEEQCGTITFDFKVE